MPTISIYLPDEDVAKLERMEKLENRNTSNMVSTLVKEGFVKRFVVVVKQSVMPGPADAINNPIILDVTDRDDGPEYADLVPVA